MTIKTHRLPENVRATLSRSTIVGLTLTLPGQLPRAEYQAVAKAIETAGGKWSTKFQCHTFPTEAALAKLTEGIEAGAIVDEKKTRQAFYTPAALAEKVAEMACVSGCNVLEPSAGGGALIDACLKAGAATVTAIEADPGASAGLIKRFAAAPVFTTTGDFLSFPPQLSADCVVMNPPFTNGQDVQHVTHALGFLKDGGRLVAIMSGNDQTSRWKRFREVLGIKAKSWEVEPVEAGAFRESGTDVATLILTVRK